MGAVLCQRPFLHVCVGGVVVFHFVSMALVAGETLVATAASVACCSIDVVSWHAQRHLLG